MEDKQVMKDYVKKVRHSLTVRTFVFYTKLANKVMLLAIYTILLLLLIYIIWQGGCISSGDGSIFIHIKGMKRFIYKT